MRNTLGGSSAYHPDGVIDVGIIVVSIFKNPLREGAVKFLRDVLLRRRRAAIPVTAILGAFHIATRYLKSPTMGVREALLKMLETRSPAFHPHVSLDDAIDAIEYATYYGVKSWDGYMAKLAKSVGNSIVYTLDEELRKVGGLVVVNPFSRASSRSTMNTSKLGCGGTHEKSEG